MSMSWLSVWWNKMNGKETVMDAAVQAVQNTDAVIPAVLGAITSDLLTPDRKRLTESIERKLSLLPLMLKQRNVPDAIVTFEDLLQDWEELKASFVHHEEVR